MIKNIFKKSYSIKLRNFFSIKPTYFNINYLKENLSISDGFFWRLDENFSTIFKFTNLIKLFLKKNSTIEIIFFDNNHQFLSSINLETEKYCNEIVLTKNMVKKFGYGIFYIFHKSDHKFKSIIRNSCYVGYSYKNNLYSFVHGNTPASIKNISNFNSDLEINIAGMSFFKKKYVVQNSFKNSNVDIMLLNSTNFHQKIYLNKKKFILGKGCSDIFNIQDEEKIEIISNCYLLRPIIFEYKEEFLNVYHG